MIDLDELRNRINQIRAGTLPREAVTDDELREALEYLRASRKQRTGAKAAAREKKDALADIIATQGSLLDKLNQIKVED